PMHPRSRRTPTARRRPRALACAAATLAALLTACGSSGDDGPRDKGQKGDERTTAPGGSRSGAPVITPTATAPIPRGKGSKLPDDLNGDGYPELALPLVGNKKEAQPTRLAFVHGSSRGVNPATRTVLTLDDLGLPARGADVPPVDTTRIATADLDGDGYADLVTPVCERLSEAESDRLHTTVGTVPYITWGGRRWATSTGTATTTWRWCARTASPSSCSTGRSAGTAGPPGRCRTRARSTAAATSASCSPTPSTATGPPTWWCTP
ncbi:FG-GAP repeat domain-containing protein, partial [Streptomyces milbemycinicus]|uniref:FG-GAP repeat domain-containing protein n=1 Tax=Streptomyces milbemycinicus TaxID=476552 RepID=UPI001FEA67AA